MPILGPDTLGALPGLRAEAESRFTETFTVFYETTGVLNEATGLYEPTEVPVYSGVAGQFKFPTLTVQERAQGAQVPATQDVVIKVAVGSTPNVEKNHFWRCTASAVDSSLVGRVVRTSGIPQGGQVTTWRYPVEQFS